MEGNESQRETWEISHQSTEATDDSIPVTKRESEVTHNFDTTSSATSLNHEQFEHSVTAKVSIDESNQLHHSNSEAVDGMAKYYHNQKMGDFSEISSQRTMENSNSPKITVKQPSKIDIELSKKVVDLGGPSKKTVIFKWIVTLVLCVMCGGCVVLSKITLTELAMELYLENDGYGYTAYSMILVILLVPNAFNLLRAMWMSLLRKDMPWPSRKSVLLLLGVSLVESFGICLFAFKVLAEYEAVGILATSCVFVLPVVCCIIQSRRRGGIFKFAFMVALILVGVGTIITIYGSITSDAGFKWYLPVAIFVLSLCWNPFVQEKLISTHHNSTNEQVTFGTRTIDECSAVSYSTDLDNSNTSASLRSVVSNKSDDVESSVRSGWKSTILLCLFRIPCIVGFSFVLFFLDNDNITSSSNALEEFRKSWSWAISNYNTKLFIINVSTSLVGYLMALAACRVCVQRGGFVVPVILGSIVTFILVLRSDSLCSDGIIRNICNHNSVELWLLIPAAVCLYLSVVLSYGVTLWTTETLVLHSESELFWLPAYSGVLLEEWLFIGRRNKRIESGHIKSRDHIKKTKVYICTTMYRETREEMQQLLESIGRVNQAQANGDRYFESHIIFDGGVKDKTPTDFALQLVSLLPSTLGINSIESCTKSLTPYGMSLSWRLPLKDVDGSSYGRTGILFMIHLKDNRKVKNKKRWSQIMYMSYVLDFLVCQSIDVHGKRQVDDSDAFILTTDADVDFTPSSVEALLDLMSRDQTVGAVCARTHPLGSGPLVWYQIFEYAIGHWFQKAAEHVLGSVLCAPGCFSVYRVKAVRDIVSTYATTVDKAFDFLIKDMGEDRWFCTLMVQSGWMIEYCATSENHTHCPEEFEEFYKQRRRWIASTIANLMLLMKEWKKISRFNNRVSFLFTVYQGLLLMSTLIGPSVVILVVAGGLLYGWNISVITTIILQSLVCVGFALVCLFFSETTQMTTAKILTFIYACVMMAVAVGVAQQVVSDIDTSGQSASNGTAVTPDPSDISGEFGVSLTTVYLGGLIGIFLSTALFHPREALCLVHGIWYLLCLPSGYLVLNIYSIVNITDRSWGTREEKESSAVKDIRPWYERAKDVLTKLCFCFDRGDVPDSPNPHPVHTRHHTSSVSETGQNLQRNISLSESMRKLSNSREDGLDEVDDGSPSLETIRERGPKSEFFPEEDIPIPLEEWLDRELRDDYVALFRKHGFDSTMFISGMNRKDLVNIGIKRKAHITWLLEQIELLPAFYIETKVPDNVVDWLQEIGLSEYYKNFKANKITNAKEMETLKSFSRKEIEKELKITKAGHVKRLLNAIKHLRKPSKEEIERNNVKKQLENAIMHRLENTNKEELEFWHGLREACLEPSSDAFGHQEELKVKLAELRNNFLLILAIVNTLWLILLATLATKTDLKVVGSDPVGLVFLSIFGFIFVLQYLCMFVHRLMTLGHFCARAPYKFDQSYATSWSFTDKKSDFESTDEDARAILHAREGEMKGRERLKKGLKSRSIKSTSQEHIPILNNQEFKSYTNDYVTNR